MSLSQNFLGCTITKKVEEHCFRSAHFDARSFNTAALGLRLEPKIGFRINES